MHSTRKAKRRDGWLCIRVTSDEHHQVRTVARLYGYSSSSRFVRDLTSQLATRLVALPPLQDKSSHQTVAAGALPSGASDPAPHPIHREATP